VLPASQDLGLKLIHEKAREIADLVQPGTPTGLEKWAMKTSINLAMLTASKPGKNSKRGGDSERNSESGTGRSSVKHSSEMISIPKQ